MMASYISFSTDQDLMGLIALKEQSWAEIIQPTLAYRRLLLVPLALGVIVPVLVTAYRHRGATRPGWRREVRNPVGLFPKPFRTWLGRAITL